MPLPGTPYDINELAQTGQLLPDAQAGIAAAQGAPVPNLYYQTDAGQPLPQPAPPPIQEYTAPYSPLPPPQSHNTTPQALPPPKEPGTFKKLSEGLDSYKKSVGDWVKGHTFENGPLAGKGEQLVNDPRTKGAIDRATAAGRVIMSPIAAPVRMIQSAMSGNGAPPTPPATTPPQPPATTPAPDAVAPPGVAPFRSGSGSIFGGGGGATTQTVGAVNNDLVDPTLQGNLSAARANERRVLRQAGDAETAVGKANADAEQAKAGALQNVADEQKKQGNEAQARGDARAAQEAESQGKFDALSAKVNAESKEDPERFWKNQSTGQKVGYGIALALGTVGSSFLGEKHNQVLDMINRHIDDDIASQRANYQHDRNRLGDVKDLYGMARQSGLDNEAATRFAKEHMLGAARTMVDQTAAQQGTQQSMANADLLKKKLAIPESQVLTAEQKDAIAEHQYVGAHTVTTGSGVDMNKVIKRGQEIRDKAMAEGHGEMTIEEAQRQAYREYTGHDVGSGPVTSYAKTPNADSLAREKDERGQKEESGQYKSDLGQIDKYEKDVGSLSPSLVQGLSPEARGDRKRKQDEYNSFVMQTVADAYKKRTGNVEPKSPELIHEYAKPFLVDNTGSNFEPEDVTRKKIQGLRRYFQQSNAGITGVDPNAPSATPPGFKPR